MGNFVSKINSNPKLQKAKTKLTKLAKDVYWLGSNTVWVAITAFIVLGVPVFLQYEKECQMFDMQANMMQQQAQAVEAAVSAVKQGQPV
ncbi:unnamed protein product [Vitrella brassicaformis CCMP3155]|uniref:Mitochondrial import receptor subunit TOM22 n=1 Tax=Vitrella brassicaformis (strain CCMP3155) TaxID=1169540 RepID=A0A0G4FMR1_VITBC|nr:unnamed protein product [Vitrella brassicaformis CCMP3155]|mmetsp:Transcript_48137/g.120522  ORF Transcript_48137/g.120522 Transcript_48137/m.120522 type:complete len:89 (-) Transcript_48137:289-555(-)|eukprot:CEM15533.1 unnamed protein product [Vitrella brassicaformis CCMP3155]